MVVVGKRNNIEREKDSLLEKMQQRQSLEKDEVAKEKEPQLHQKKNKKAQWKKRQDEDKDKEN